MTEKDLKLNALLNKICSKYSVEIKYVGAIDAKYKCVAFVQAYNEHHHANAFKENITKFADKLVFLDDGSTDDTAKAFMDEHVLIHLRRAENSNFDDLENRSLLLEVAQIINTKWMLFPDLDERIDPRYVKTFRQLLNFPLVDLVRFRYVHAWNTPDKYRTDYPYSENGVQPRLKMFRKKKKMKFNTRKKLHFELMPYNSQNTFHSHIVFIHLGNVKSEDRLKRYNNYRQKDPQCIYQPTYEHLIADKVSLAEFKSLYRKDGKLYLRSILMFLKKNVINVLFNKSRLLCLAL